MSNPDESEDNYERLAQKIMKTIPFRRRGWPKAKGGFGVRKAFRKWDPPRPPATATPSVEGIFTGGKYD